jgi:NAD(P)-dependent dehydrogenase (short-subunit alcohol dehydrogenase family)
MGQPAIPPTPQDASVAGKTAIITGSNTGLGLVAARQLLLLGAARVILAVRSVDKGQQAASELRADAIIRKANPGARIEVFALDLSDYSSGLKFAEKVKQEVAELDILLNNGGQVVMKYEKAPTGHEQNMQGQSLVMAEAKPTGSDCRTS